MLFENVTRNAKMLIEIAKIFSAEFTCLPRILSGYFGKFYSNALCNGCSWLFLMWYILHSGLDYALNEIFRKMKCKEYNRVRLTHCVWYLVIYSIAFMNTSTTFFKNRTGVFEFKKVDASNYNDITSDILLGYMVLLTFFLHSAFWEVMQYESKMLFLSDILLFYVLFMAFVLRILEVAFTLIAFISIAQVSIQSTKLLYVVSKQNNTHLISIFFVLAVCSFSLTLLVGVPLIFLIPFVKKIITAHVSSGFIPLTLTIGGWYLREMGNSPLFKMIGHWLFHTEKSNDSCGNIVECSLFPPRNDDAHNLQQLRREMKQREKRKLSLRRSSKKGVLVQTIKCMVSLRRKINAKRAAATQNEGNAESRNNSENAETVSESTKLSSSTSSAMRNIENSEESVASEAKVEKTEPAGKSKTEKNEGLP